MDGFVVVELLSNNTYNGTEASLKTSEINNTYLIRSDDFLQPRWDRPFDPNYQPFYGLWAYILATSVVWVPAIAMAVVFMTKMWKDNYSNAQGGRQRGSNDSFELQPLQGGAARPLNPLIPYSHPAAAQPQPASKPASQAQIIIVVGFLLLWRCIGLAITIQRIVFVAKLLPWIQTPEMEKCMRENMGPSSNPSLWPWLIIVPGAYLAFFHTVLMVLRIWAAITTMTRRKMWFMDPFEKTQQMILVYIKIWLCALVEVFVFVIVLGGHDFRFCVDSGRYHDLHTLMLSYVPGIVWVIIDRVSRPILRHYLTAFGFPRYPPMAQDALGLEGPIADASVGQRTASSSTW